MLLIIVSACLCRSNCHCCALSLSDDQFAPYSDSVGRYSRQWQTECPTRWWILARHYCDSHVCSVANVALIFIGGAGDGDTSHVTYSKLHVIAHWSQINIHKSQIKQNWSQIMFTCHMSPRRLHININVKN